MGRKSSRPPSERAASSDRVAPQFLADLQGRLESRETRLAEELSMILDRLDRHEEALATLLPDETASRRRTRILREAAALEKRWPDPLDRPPLFGALIGVKDLFHTAGFPTRGGSALPADVFTGEESPGRPEDNRDEASVVSALREAGALILGKTVTTEFAYFGPGPTKNPWNTDHTPGGSSSGSAAAIAAGFCHIALGTQTIGSISRPASFCGVTGYKPSYGRIAADGVIPFSADADHVGIIAADAWTLARAASVAVTDWSADRSRTTRPTTNGKSRRVPKAGADLRHLLGTVLVPDDAYLAQADTAGLRGLDAAIERLIGLGVEIQRVSIFSDIESINGAHNDMIARDFAEVHKGWYEEHHERYHPRSAQLIERGASVTDERREEARAGRFRVRERIERALERHGADIWLAPATVGEAPRGIETTGDPAMNLPWTYAGLPTVSVPITGLPNGRGPMGLPLGIQIASRYGSDEQLLHRAAALEAHLL
ncbi:MAG: amidase [Spirochaetales bacterium]|nr:amidase [Spirochaetales bacterium]